MAKVKFTITGEFPAEEVLEFAKARGYQEELLGPVGEDGVVTSSPNPMSAETYVAQMIKAQLVQDVSGVTEARIRQEFEANLNSRISGLRNSVKGKISITPKVV